MDDEVRKTLAEMFSEDRKKTEEFLASLPPASQVSSDSELLKLIRSLADELGTNLPLDAEYGPYLQRLSFSSLSLTTIPHEEIESAWTHLLTTCNVDLEGLTNYGIAEWYEHDNSKPIHALAVYRHFLRQAEEEGPEGLSIDDEFFVSLVTTAAEKYGTIIAKRSPAVEPSDAAAAEQDLRQRHPKHFGLLGKETQRNLTKANAAFRVFSEGWPELVPFYYQRAVESEFNEKVYPRVQRRLPEFRRGAPCNKDKCGKYRFDRSRPFSSLTLNQFSHYLREHLLPAPDALLSQEQDRRCLETLRLLEWFSGRARHGKTTRYTIEEMRDLLKRLEGDGDKRIIDVLVWFSQTPWLGA